MCPHISHPPKWRKSSKKVSHMLRKNNFPGRGDERLLLPPPPNPAMVGGKSRPLCRGTFCYFFSSGGGGFFYHVWTFLLRFPLMGGLFTMWGPFCYIFPLMRGLFHYAILLFFSMWGPFCYVFLLGGGGFLHHERAFIATLFSLWGAFLQFFLYVGDLFLIIGGLFWASPLPTIRYETI